MKVPHVRIIDPDTLDLRGQLACATDIIYVHRWQTHGEFQITVPVPSAGVEQIAIGRYILLDADPHRAGVIEQIVREEKGMAILKISGRSLSCLAADRLTVPPDDSINMGWDMVPRMSTPGVYPNPVSVETILKTYATRHMTGAPRDMRITVAPDLRRGKTALWRCRWEQLDNVLTDVAAYGDTGYEIALDWQNKRLLFDVVPGTDRSVESGVSPVIFAHKFGNLESLTYTVGVTNYRNVGYVGGAGEDESRLVQSVWLEDTRPEGRDRREVWIDAGQLDIESGLLEEGRHKLADYPKTETIHAKVNLAGPFVYRRDWDLGDLVTIQTGEWGASKQPVAWGQLANKAYADLVGQTYQSLGQVVTATYAQLNTRVTEITEHYAPDGLGLDVTFGLPAPDIGRVIRQKTRMVVR